ncbi:MAG: ATP-binding cassette domain-containing protein, partial [Bacilli bacterium]|nr:ATP-binding cassette domain-containing protein [Bacilli bacterium]
MAYLLRCEKLTKEYGKAGSLVRAVNRANICFPQKGLIAISGKSGCGKSTLLSLLASLEKPTKGRIFFQGEDISNYPPDKLAKYRGQCTGMIFQHYNLFEDDTALQNVELPLLINGYSRKDARSIALKTMQDFMMQAFADRKVSTLSGGEKQRIAICRAMASAPKILFADEPTGALDEHNSKLVMDALKRMAQSILVIIVSHNGQLIEEYADAIIHMASGKIIDKPTFIQDKGTAKKLRPHSNSFVARFVKKNMKANKANGILCGFASSVGFLSLCITLGYFYGSRAAVDELPLRCYDSSVASLCVEEKIETDSAIALVQQVRPEIEAASNYVGPDFIVDYDLSYFFPKAYAYSLNGVAHDPIMFSPVYDLSPNYGYGGLLDEGSPTSSLDMDVCLINDLLFEQLGPDCIGQSIEMEFANQVTSYGASDEVRIAVKMEIMGVVNEFSFLNEPKIYYSYMAAKNSLLSFELQNAGMAYGRELTALDVVAQAPGDSATSGFSLNVFAKNFNQSKKLFDFMAKEQTDGYSIQSRSYSA